MTDLMDIFPLGRGRGVSETGLHDFVSERLTAESWAALGVTHVRETVAELDDISGKVAGETLVYVIKDPAHTAVAPTNGLYLWTSGGWSYANPLAPWPAGIEQPRSRLFNGDFGTDAGWTTNVPDRVYDLTEDARVDLDAIVPGVTRGLRVLRADGIDGGVATFPVTVARGWVTIAFCTWLIAGTRGDYGFETEAPFCRLVRQSDDGLFTAPLIDEIVTGNVTTHVFSAEITEPVKELRVGLREDYGAPSVTRTGDFWLTGIFLAATNVPLPGLDYTAWPDLDVVTRSAVATPDDVAAAVSGLVGQARQVATAGLATGGGALNENRTITVTKASAADVTAGTRDDAAVTPAALKPALDARVPTSRTLASAGLLTGGGALDQNRTLTVPAADSGEVEAGVSVVKAVTPAALKPVLDQMARKGEVAGISFLPGWCGFNSGQYTDVVTGPVSGKPSYTAASTTITTRGRALSLTGSGRIAPVQPAPVSVGKYHRYEFRFRRGLDPADPSGHTVFLKASWQDANGNEIGQTILAQYDDFRLSDGYITEVGTFSISDLPNLTVPYTEVPLGTQQMVAYLETPDGLTDGRLDVYFMLAREGLEPQEFVDEAQSAADAAAAEAQTAIDKAAEAVAAAEQAALDVEALGVEVDDRAAIPLRGVEYAMTIVDETGQIALAVDRNAGWHFPGFEMRFAYDNPIGGYARVWTDDDDRVALGILTDGRTQIGQVTMETTDDGGVYPPMAWIDQENRVAVSIQPDGALGAPGVDLVRPPILEPALAITDEAGRSVFEVSRDGRVYAEGEPIGRPVTRAPDLPVELAGIRLYEVNCIAPTHQSLGLGTAAVPAITTTQPYDHLMFAGGLGGDVSATHADPPVPLAEALQETPWSGFANGVTLRREIERRRRWESHGARFFVSAPGEGGQTLADLTIGTPLGDRKMADLAAMAAWAEAQGHGAGMPAELIMQGEADYDGSPISVADRKAELIAHQVAVEAAVQAAFGTAAPVPVIYYSLSTHRKRSALVPTVALAHHELAVESPLFYLACPMHWAEYADDLHLKNWASERAGRYYAKAFHRLFVDRRKWEHLHWKHMDWQGRVITLYYDPPCERLEWDHDWITPLEHFGFDVKDAADQVTSLDVIRHVDIVGDDRVVIQLASDPGPGAGVSYAFGGAENGTTSGRRAGPRGQLRDCEGHYDQYRDAAGTLHRMHNYAVIQWQSRS